MKTYKNIFKATFLLAAMSLGMVSCNDWLTLYPQTQIVEENFWEDKNDLEGVRYAVYKNMANQVEKMIVWGDLRSDVYRLNTQQHSDQGNRDKFRNIIQANIDTTWADYDWSGMYTTIGYCNKVLQHGEEVLEKDKQFTASEWRQMKAEMVTMRAMCYFYLVRAFKNVPFTTKVINSDSDVEYFPQVPALEVLTKIIADVESIAGTARNRFVSKNDTKGMITNSAIYALLSDMYLWRASMYEGRSLGAPATDDSTTGNDSEENTENATESRADENAGEGSGDETGENTGGDNTGGDDNTGDGSVITDYRAQAIKDYQACIRNSELAIGKLKDQFDEERKGLGSYNIDQFMSWTNAPQFDGKTIDFMYKNDVEDADKQFVSMDAYDEIFTKGNSYESIFELQFSVGDGRENGTVNSMWGMANGTHLVTSYSDENKKDLRYWFSAWKNVEGASTSSADYYCLKWNAVDVEISGFGSEEKEVLVTDVATNKYNNWIIYRLSDVLLQNAEARACLVKLNVEPQTNIEVCQQILRMVNRRWWVNLTEGQNVDTDVSKPKNDIDFPNNGKYLEQVMETRKIEFVGEGKRWFDLVRYAERLSSSDEDAEGMRTMYNTFMSSITGYETARNRCETLWGLYCPIYYMECKAYRAGGYNITQNPVWNKSKYDRK